MDDLQDRVSLSVNDTGTCTTIDTPVTQAGSPAVPAKYPPIPCGWTYFIERSDGLIKIGFSAKPSSRIGNHRREFGNIKILAVVPHKALTLLRSDALERDMRDLAIIYGWALMRRGEEIVMAGKGSALPNGMRGVGS